MLLCRGASMRLNGKVNTSRLTHCSLDLYLLQMHSAELAEVLRCFLAFGRRILPLVNSSPDSDAWWLSDEVSVQRRHWFLLCRRLMNLLCLLGLDTSNQTAPLPLNPWPDLTSLCSAAAEVREVFGGFEDTSRLLPGPAQPLFFVSLSIWTNNFLRRGCVPVHESTARQQVSEHDSLLKIFDWAKKTEPSWLQTGEKYIERDKI
jgi:hypothetical protein